MGGRLPAGGYGKQTASQGPDSNITLLIYIKIFNNTVLINHLLWITRTAMFSSIVRADHSGIHGFTLSESESKILYLYC